jgi:hypothetical protein
VRFLAAARSELRSAFEYFEAQRPGLGLEFIEDVAAAVGHIREQPRMQAMFGKRLRRWLTRRFRYRVIYHVTQSKSASSRSRMGPAGRDTGQIGLMHEAPM